MQLTWDEIQARAVAFSKRWKDAHNEEAQAQSFELDFLRVFGVTDPEAVGDFEYKVPLHDGKMGYIDYLWKGQIAIEMKSKGKDLGAAFSQLQNYLKHLPDDDIPDLWLVCDFENMRLTRRSTNEIFNFKTKELRKHIKRFANIAGYATERIRENQIEVNVRAAEKMAKLHDALREHGYEGHELEVYLVRLLFCLFADDTGIFPQDSFFRYIEQSKLDGSDLSERIGKLFEVLNIPQEIRNKRTLLSDELKQFRYINGGLFNSLLPSAEFNVKMRQILLDCNNFDWNKISPAIFGAMFQGVMDKNQRREMGAHYTSEENILKLVNPLFLDDLWKEFEHVKTDQKALDNFHEKISRLKFLDPACGCGNFLIVTYRELRLLELEILKMKIGSNQLVIDISSMLKVTVEQFYGIEYEDFPCQIAQVGMWLVDHQMNMRVSEQFGNYFVRLPLTQAATIVHGNALRIDWESVVPKKELSYILGNPPFIGYSNQSTEQKADILLVYVDKQGKPYKTAGKIDYVAAWYYKAAQYMVGTQVHTAFVSTNSITQGEQVAAIWRPLIEKFGIHINFGWRTFKWSNEAKGKAAVHCVIVGFSAISNRNKFIFNEALLGIMNNPGLRVIRKLAYSPAFQAAAKMANHPVYQRAEKLAKLARNINPYLMDAPNIFVESRKKPLCDVPIMQKGSIPVDGGNLIISGDDYERFIKSDPSAKEYIREFLGSDEFINGIKRYCLWLVGVTPVKLRQMPEVVKRVDACRQFRLNSKKEATRKQADYPSRFMEMRQPETAFLAIPEVSSERRRYIPIGYLPASTVVSNKIFTVSNATLYHFGVLTSNVHMAWMRAVCGRLEMRYSYSNIVVYNNFPWPDTTDTQKTEIDKLAQAILDARALFPDSSLADLYDPVSMPPELLKAHRALDAAVMKLYGLSVKDTTEESCVAELMERYKQLIENQDHAYKA